MFLPCSLTETGIQFRNDRTITWGTTPTDCLAVTNEQDPVVMDQANGDRKAFLVKWIGCDQSIITEIDGSGNPVVVERPIRWDPVPQPDNWFYMVPRDNYAGWNDPCLNFNTNVQSFNTLIQFKCQRNGATQELFAPYESDWVAPTDPGGGGVDPVIPSGAHLLEDRSATPIESSVDLGCLSPRADGSFSVGPPSASDTCSVFLPELTAGGFFLRSLLRQSDCLGFDNFAVRTTSCTAGAPAIWADTNISGATFQLRPANSTTYCLDRINGTALLAVCSTALTQRWYDTSIVNGPINPLYEQRMRQLVRSHSSIGLRALSVSEIYAVSAKLGRPVFGTSQQDPLIRFGLGSGDWLLADAGGFILRGFVGNPGMFGGPPTAWSLTLNGNVLTVDATGGIAESTLSPSNVQNDWGALFAGFNCSQPNIAQIEIRHGISCEEVAASPEYDALWKLVIQMSVLEWAGRMSMIFTTGGNLRIAKVGDSIETWENVSPPRPATSVWTLKPFARGFAAEDFFETVKGPGRMAPGARVIDWYNGATGEVSSWKTIDLTAASYSSGSTSRLTSVLNKYVNKLSNYQGTPQWGGVQINASSITSRELLLGVQSGVATAAQQTAIANVTTAARAVGVSVRVIVVP